jgi:hypothetical protein
VTQASGLVTQQQKVATTAVQLLNCYDEVQHLRQHKSEIQCRSLAPDEVPSLSNSQILTLTQNGTPQN